MANLIRKLEVKVNSLTVRVKNLVEWDESKHPRDPGGEGGGQFTPVPLMSNLQDVESKLDVVNKKIAEISSSSSGNSPILIRARKQKMRPLIKERDNLLARRSVLKNPEGEHAIAASSTLHASGVDGFEVRHNTRGLLGEVRKGPFSSFKTVNGAQQLTTKVGWKAVAPSGEVVGTRLDSKSSAILALARYHISSKGVANG